MPVAVSDTPSPDNASSATATTNPGALAILNVAGAIANGAVVVFCTFNTDPGAFTTKNWAAQALTEIGRHSASDGCACVMLARLGPTTGAQNINLVWTNSTGYTISAGSFSGVDQGSVAGSFINFAFSAVNVSTGTTNLPVTSAVNDYVTACSGSLNAQFNNAGAGTHFYANNTNVSGSANAEVGAAGSVNCPFGITGTTNQPAIFIGCDIAAVGTVAAANPPDGIKGLASSEWHHRPFFGWNTLRDHRWRRRGSLLIPDRKIIYPRKKAA